MSTISTLHWAATDASTALVTVADPLHPTDWVISGCACTTWQTTATCLHAEEVAAAQAAALLMAVKGVAYGFGDHVVIGVGGWRCSCSPVASDEAPCVHIVAIRSSLRLGGLVRDRRLLSYDVPADDGETDPWHDVLWSDGGSGPATLSIGPDEDYRDVVRGCTCAAWSDTGACDHAVSYNAAVALASATPPSAASTAVLLRSGARVVVDGPAVGRCTCDDYFAFARCGHLAAALAAITADDALVGAEIAAGDLLDLDS